MARPRPTTAGRHAKQPAAVPVDVVSARRRTAFSYLRVSSTRQAGDARSGLDRQADQFLPFCDRHGLVPSLDPLVDAGISAYRGRNHLQGALGQFLAAARDGLIPEGSVLVVEDLDRFSRKAASYAEAQLGELFALGLALGIVRDDVVVDRATYDNEIGIRLQLLVRRDAAHDYSRKLGERVSAAHERIRAREREGHVVNAHWRPQWLDFDEHTSTFTANDRWPAYRRMIDLCLQGYGQVRVAAILNGEGHRNSRGELWSGASVVQVWRDRRLIGDRIYGRGRKQQPEILKGYFPAMITAAEWDRLQAAIEQRANNVGRAGRGEYRHNILQGIVYCTCGTRRELQTSTKPNGRKHQYLVCKTKTRGRRVDGACTAKNVVYDERWLLQAFMGQRWKQYFNRPADTRQRRQLEAELITAEALLATRQQQQASAESNVQRLLTMGQLDSDDAALLLKMARNARQQAADAEQAVRGAQQRLQQHLARPTGESVERMIRGRVEAFLAGGLDDPAERIRFNAWLNTLSLRVVVSNDERLQLSVEPSIRATTDTAGNVTLAGAELVMRVP